VTQPPTDAPVPPPPKRVGSVVIVNTGDGKGKSTAAFGVVMRAVARGWRVCVIQFLKSNKWHTGEEDMARRLGVDFNPLGDGFTWDSDDLDGSRKQAVAAWDTAKRAIASGEYNLVVVDEITYPMNWEWISTQDVLETIRSRPESVNVVATGRDAPDDLIAIADTATEMRKIKHAYDEGVRARRGIDF
jgi:cob(I)alamin adenosyltransferase